MTTFVIETAFVNRIFQFCNNMQFELKINNDYSNLLGA